MKINEASLLQNKGVSKIEFINVKSVRCPPNPMFLEENHFLEKSCQFLTQ